MTYIKTVLKILLWLTISISIFSLGYYFYQPGITIFNINIHNPFYEYIESLELWLYLVVCFSVITIINVFILIFLSLYYDYTREIKTKLRLRYETLFSEKIAEYLLSDKYDDKTKISAFVNSIKRFTKKRIQIESLFSIYTNIQENLAVNLSDKFKILLKELGVYDKQKSFLYSTKNDKRILAMKMLSYLRISDYRDRILQYTQSKNFALRTEAYAALIRLMEKDDSLLVFIGIKHRLSLLDINVILNAVLKNFKTDIDYPALINSDLESKTILGALLIKHRKLKEYSDLLFQQQHFESRDILFKQVMWDSYLELVTENEAVDTILKHFNNEPDDVKHVILEKVDTITNKRFLNLLVNTIESQTLLNKIEALKLLFNNDVDKFISFKDSKNPEIVMAVNEVSDININ